MAMEDDIFSGGKTARPSGHEVGSDLSSLSETEIEERIGLFTGEIERLKQALSRKRASREAAEGFFKL